MTEQYAPIEIDSIFSIVLSDAPSFLGGKTKAFDLNIRSFRACYPKARHAIFNNRQIRKLVAENFSGEVLDAYDLLTPYAYKADLARYCLLYVKGGLYSDISHLHVNAIKLSKNTSTVLFRDIAFIHPPFSVSNAVIFARPGQELFQKLIQAIVRHCDNHFYGSHPLEPTGPYLLGRELAKLDSFDGMLFGDSTAMVVGASPEKAKNHIAKFAPDGELIAFRNKKSNSSVDEFIRGGNDYAQLWHDREVYGERSRALDQS